MAGSGGGSVGSIPPATFFCPSTSGTCSQTIPLGTVLTLTATADSNSSVGSWGGACTGTGDCAVTMNSVQGVIATFNLKPAYVSAIPAYFNSLAAAYAAAPDGATIQAQVTTFRENLDFNKPVTVTLAGGKSVDYLTLVGVTTLQGTLTVSRGVLTIGDVLIK